MLLLCGLSFALGALTVAVVWAFRRRERPEPDWRDGEAPDPWDELSAEERAELRRWTGN